MFIKDLAVRLAISTPILIIMAHVWYWIVIPCTYIATHNYVHCMLLSAADLARKGSGGFHYSVGYMVIIHAALWFIIFPCLIGLVSVLISVTPRFAVIIALVIVVVLVILLPATNISDAGYYTPKYDDRHSLITEKISTKTKDYYVYGTSTYRGKGYTITAQGDLIIREYWRKCFILPTLPTLWHYVDTRYESFIIPAGEYTITEYVPTQWAMPLGNTS